VTVLRAVTPAVFDRYHNPDFVLCDAARYTLSAVMRKGRVVTTEIFMFERLPTMDDCAGWIN
jgi:hypothetical protein